MVDKKEEKIDKEDIKIREKIKHDLDSLSVIEEEKDNESERQKTLQILLEKKNINLKTELSDDEILELTKLEVINERIHSTSLSTFMSKFKELRVSKDRQGRKEIIGAMQDDETKKGGGFFDQFITDMIGGGKPK